MVIIKYSETLDTLKYNFWNLLKTIYILILFNVRLPNDWAPRPQHFDFKFTASSILTMEDILQYIPLYIRYSL